MPGLTPRHRRKSGSGPPASALIAWISTDPYLRDTAATVCHRHQMDLVGLSRARATKAAAAACFVVTCIAVLGISTIISHGRAATPLQIAAPSLGGQGNTVSLASPAPMAVPPAEIAAMLAHSPHRGGTGAPSNIGQPGSAGNPGASTSSSRRQGSLSTGQPRFVCK